MALVKPGPMVGSQRGSIGTVTLQGGPYGCVAHAKGRRVQTDSGMKGDHLQRFYRAVAGWRRLPREERGAWAVYAAHSAGVGAKGHWGTWSGRQAYMAASITQNLVHGPGAVSIPGAGYVAPLETFSVSAAETGPAVVLTFTPTPMAGDEWMMLWFGVFRSSGAHFPGSGWWGPAAVDPSVPSGIDLGAVLAGENDSFQQGRVLGVRAAVYSGTVKRVSPAREVRVVVTG